MNTRVVQSSQPARASATMQSMRLNAPGPFLMTQTPQPEPGAGQVRIRIEGCGVCASSLPLWQGRDWFKYPRKPGAPGHEAWGFVDAFGEGVHPDLELGDRVAALSYHGFAEYDIADADSVVKLPHVLDGEPFPGEALACAMNAFARSDIQSGQTVAIVGIGFLGAVLTQLAAGAGAEVVAVSRRQFALDIARECGAAHAVPLQDVGSTAAAVNRCLGRDGCARVIEAAGIQHTLDVASELTAVHGRLIVAGYHQDGMRSVDMQKWNWRGIDVVNAHERDPAQYVRGMRQAVDAVISGRIRPARLYTVINGLDGLERAFSLMEQRPDGFIKAVVNI